MDTKGFSILLKSRSISVDFCNFMNDLIRDELHAMSTYLWQAAVVDGWGHTRLGAKFQAEAREEMDHAKKLMDRLTVFEELPVLDKLKNVEPKKSVKEMLLYDVTLEEKAIENYNKAHKMACSEQDNGSRRILASILDDEEGHFDWLKAQTDRISAMGEERYLINLGEFLASLEESD